MILQDPTFEIWEQAEGIDGILKIIEKAGRICYKSVDKITPDSAAPFVGRLENSHHYAMLEHGAVYLKAPKGTLAERYQHNRFARFTVDDNYDYVSTNYCVIIENGWKDDLQYLCLPTPLHERRVTVYFRTQIAISREYNRHRVNSIAESSTRYCNYSKDKFGNQVTVNRPSWIDDEQLEHSVAYDYTHNAGLFDAEEEAFAKMAQEITLTNDGSKADNTAELPQGNDNYLSGSPDWTAIDYWWFANKAAEFAYLNLIRLGWKAQQARTILPLDTQTELIHTAFVSDWRHFFDLRALGTTGAPHPDAKILAEPLRQEFIKRGYIEAK